MTVEESKGETLGESKFQIIPLAGLLPVSMALENSLRYLINLVFPASIRTWHGLYQLKLLANARKTGRRIRMNPAVKDVPVLWRIAGHRVTNEPVMTNYFYPEIRRLGIHCGFQNRLDKSIDELRRLLHDIHE